MDSALPAVSPLNGGSSWGQEDGPNSRFPSQPPGGSETRLKTAWRGTGVRPHLPLAKVHPQLDTPDPEASSGLWSQESRGTMEKHEGGRTAGPESHSWVRMALAVPPGGRLGCGKTGTAREEGQKRHQRRRGRGQDPAP